MGVEWDIGVGVGTYGRIVSFALGVSVVEVDGVGALG